MPALPEIIAHRGASSEAPENTLAAFQLGYQQNADAAECDIRLTRDGRIAVIHDADTRRVSHRAWKIAGRTFQELRRLEVGQWGRWQGKGFAERIPSLREVLALVPDGKRVFIEIKCDSAVLPRLRRELERASVRPAQTVLLGFDYETVRQAKAAFPQLQVLGLAARGLRMRRHPPLEKLIRFAQAARLDGLDLKAGFPLDREFVAKVHEAGLRLYTWTVDNPAAARRLTAAGVDGITTNRPGWLRTRL